MNEDDLKLKCLELALTYYQGHDVLEKAREFSDFVLGTKDAEVIRAAQELSEKVKK